MLAIALRQAARRGGHDLQAVTAAVILASRVHRNQRRSADGQPYLVHPLQVALLVCHWGGSQDDVITALLHDTAEDNPDGPRAILNHIADLFGDAVSQRVSAVTKNRGIANASDRAQDLLMRLCEALPQLGPGVAAIRLADRLHNTVTSNHFDAARLQRLLLDNQHTIKPVADQVCVPAVGQFLIDGPARWWRVSPSAFLPEMLALQPPWLPLWQHRRATAALPTCPSP